MITGSAITGSAIKRLGIALATGAAALLGASTFAPAHAATRSAPAAHTVQDCAHGCPVMAVIPTGSFIMGADAGEADRPEGAPHKVVIAQPFALATREVTNGEYAQFIAETGYVSSKGCRSFIRATGKIEVVPEADWRHPGVGAGEGQANIPVVCVSWRDAVAYTKWLSGKTAHHYRLPTEAEWEYAARDGTQGDFPWAGGVDAACRHANMLDADGMADGSMAVFGGTGGLSQAAPCHDGHAAVAPVGSYPANGFGLYDMIGNVWEWTADCYIAPYPADAPIDGRPVEVKGDCPRRAVRGGSWITAPFRNRVTWRGRDPEDQVTWIFGFRVARDLTPAEAKAARSRAL
ncbi:MAG TPA: formylglycine-generating enzyme family protein [Novosphingobium sp.]|nr:formylglycine-generating enzyme family protein [Novosphingobium sp.]